MAETEGDHGEHGAYSEVFEEGEVSRAQTVHRIRANSSIMQLKKILGEYRRGHELNWALSVLDEC